MLGFLEQQFTDIFTIAICETFLMWHALRHRLNMNINEKKEYAVQNIVVLICSYVK